MGSQARTLSVNFAGKCTGKLLFLKVGLCVRLNVSEALRIEHLLLSVQSQDNVEKLHRMQDEKVCKNLASYHEWLLQLHQHAPIEELHPSR